MNDARQTSNEWSAMRHATVRYGCVLDDRAVVSHGLRGERERDERTIGTPQVSLLSVFSTDGNRDK